MSEFVIRPACEDEFDAIARLWMESAAHANLCDPSEAFLSELRARIPQEIAKGWRLYVTDDDGRIVAMLAIVPKNGNLDQIFVAPGRQGEGIGKALLAFARTQMPREIRLRTAAANARAIAWYEREGFVREKVEQHPASGLIMAYYRWKA